MQHMPQQSQMYVSNYKKQRDSLNKWNFRNASVFLGFLLLFVCFAYSFLFITHQSVVIGILGSATFLVLICLGTWDTIVDERIRTIDRQWVNLKEIAHFERIELEGDTSPIHHKTFQRSDQEIKDYSQKHLMSFGIRIKAPSYSSVQVLQGHELDGDNIHIGSVGSVQYVDVGPDMFRVAEVDQRVLKVFPYPKSSLSTTYPDHPYGYYPN